MEEHTSPGELPPTSRGGGGGSEGPGWELASVAFFHVASIWHSLSITSIACPWREGGMACQGMLGFCILRATFSDDH